jgi:hypothetical protein
MFRKLRRLLHGRSSSDKLTVLLVRASAIDALILADRLQPETKQQLQEAREKIEHRIQKLLTK